MLVADALAGNGGKATEHGSTCPATLTTCTSNSPFSLHPHPTPPPHGDPRGRALSGGHEARGGRVDGEPEWMHRAARYISTPALRGERRQPGTCREGKPCQE